MWNVYDFVYGLSAGVYLTADHCKEKKLSFAKNGNSSIDTFTLCSRSTGSLCSSYTGKYAITIDISNGFAILHYAHASAPLLLNLGHWAFTHVNLNIISPKGGLCA